MLCAPVISQEITERPPGFIAPNLSPVGLRLHPAELARGVYALMANQPPKDNNGLIVGEKAALVVDAGVTPGIGRHIQEVAAGLTDVPIRYLVNTTYHGDHTFGNAAFGDEVTIYSSRANKAAMTDLAAAKRARAESMYGDAAALDEVITWRRPDVVVDRFCEIDLGGRVVHLWHFGPGNGSGDTIVHVPDAKIAWTGNFAGPAGGIVPMCLVGDPAAYVTSLRTMRATLEVDTLVPGHGFLGPAEPGIGVLIGYLEQLNAAVTRHHQAGRPIETLYDAPLWGIDFLPGLPEAFTALMRSLHRLNILLTYRWLTGEIARVAA
ncbi:MBL fold metallo-hydrolase [Nonomuraea sp. NPDC004354]